MEVKQINQLMVAMGRYGVKRVRIKREGVEVEIEREETGPSLSQIQELLQEENPLRTDFEKHKALGPVRSDSSIATTKKVIADDILNERDDDVSIFITSPMVGTVYTSPSPTEPAFIKIGDKIDKNTVVCIVEAMKVMNEVKAGVTGIVQEILVDIAQPVEFGTKLVRITPN